MPRKSKINKKRSERMQRYWRYMAFLQKNFSGSDERSQGMRQRAFQFTKIKIGRTPNIRTVRKFHTKLRKVIKKAKKKARKDIIDLTGPEFADVVEIDEFVDDFFEDSLLGDFVKEVHDSP